MQTNHGLFPTPPSVSSKANSTGNSNPNQMSKAEEQKLDFLKLFCVELQNQTPDDTVDTSKMMQQLSSFTAVEQQIQTNDHLTKLVDLQVGTALNKTTDYIGKEVGIDSSSAELINGSANFNYKLPSESVKTNIQILDDKNNIVLSLPGQLDIGVHEYKWNGKTVDGKQMKDGTYKIKVSAHDVNGAPIIVDSLTTGRVDEAKLFNNKPKLIINGQPTAMDKIISISDSNKNSANIITPKTLAEGINYMGKSVTADFSTVDLVSNQAIIGYELYQDAHETQISIIDEKGKFIGNIIGNKTMGKHFQKWEGKMDNGSIVKDGQYKVSVQASGKKGEPIKVNNTAINGIATDVIESDGRISLKVNNVSIPLDNIKSVNIPNTGTAATNDINYGLNEEIKNTLQKLNSYLGPQANKNPEPTKHQANNTPATQQQTANVAASNNTNNNN
jgi:flagellar basal-body rod modification protein FlgD